MDSPRRVALFGGTFDPVHLGHLAIAGMAREKMNLDRVIFIPCRQSPHKDQRPRASEDERIEMLELALAEEPWAVVSEIEMQLPPPSYSWVTAEAMAEIYSESRLFWLMGSDQWNAIQTWTRPGHLADLVEFIVHDRGDNPRPQPGFRVHFVPGSHPASASEIRGQAPEFLHSDWLHPDVAAFILARALYGCRS
jgi:nicotinate-nucleotide adenylyltransferase